MDMVRKGFGNKPLKDLTMERKRAFRENFEGETLEKNKINSSPIFITRLFKFLNSLPLHC